MRDEQPDVGEQRRGLEVLTSRLVEAVHRRGRVEQLRGRAGDVDASARGRSSHCSMRCSTLRAGHVAQVVERAAAGALHGVEQHAFAQRVVAETIEPLDVERVA